MTWSGRPPLGQVQTMRPLSPAPAKARGACFQPVRSHEDKGPGVVFGLIVRAEDSDSRSDSQENDSRPLYRPRQTRAEPGWHKPLARRVRGAYPTDTSRCVT